MTLFLPLESSSSLPQNPPFLVPSPEPSAHVKRVVKAVMKARRIAVVCGAGISVQAGIPDFRSSDGLFQSLKKDNPSLSSGKDLFDAAVFNSEGTTSTFCQMIAQLHGLSMEASPTPFHKLLRALDDRRRLLRVYTQNIDALEQKSGLTFGVPEPDGKRYKPRSSKGKLDNVDEDGPSTLPPPSQTRLPTPPIEIPRCIPLHGTLQYMHCQVCTRSFPLHDHLDALSAGKPPYCPECTLTEDMRQLVGKRSRGVGKLRPSVVLYNEMHKDGEEVGDVVRKDLLGSSKGKGRAGADLLLVVGTSLRVPGTKRIVREFSKAVHMRSTAPPSQSWPSGSTAGLETSTSRRASTDDEEPPIRTIYLNLDFPVPTREWEGVFDVWIKGDAQSFAQMVHDEMEREEQAKAAAVERKRQREEAALAAQLEEMQVDKPQSSSKRKPSSAVGSQAPKKRKVTPLTPVSVKRRTTEKPSSKKCHDSTLPVLHSSSAKKLTIKIPPRPRPKVIHSPPPPQLFPPPSSPLTPAPSPTPPRRTMSPAAKRKRLLVKSPSISARIPQSAAAQVAAKAHLDWDAGDELTDLSDDESSDVDSSMSAANASSSKAAEGSSKSDDAIKDDSQPHLGMLEEDDEFEEFAVADWDDSETDLAHLGGAAPGAAKSGGDKLWEDNWDDDDIEDDFSIQLRNELAKKSAPEPMQH
ncbi:DHS-like NAD/FAD-binding domain-containing protein [Wolfiporia cocos MD-104 SS10]|uniref:DHS-like NAD/FAD-binding domain-containing protein n=1 Tax=Wolfiporia cocos (strain MD-104) TaxID=742152 RepID=A0A2H3JJV9_WOLCO|nr:DHS-like NAD/FAD-binding domain-containing protein [Wolfiporia cocos MD-104 SS10]